MNERDYRILGNTGLRASKLGLGAAALGGEYGEISDAEVARMLHGALDAGINIIDTAPFYGLTRSEKALGKVLPEIARDRYILATKCGRYGMDSFDFSAERVTRSVDESLARLKIDSIDIFQVHDIEFGSLEQVVNETLPALERLRDAGKFRFLGVTGLPLKIFPYVIERHRLDTIISYSHYTLIDRSLKRLFPLLRERGVGLFNASPVSLGLLSPQGPREWHPAPDDLKEFCKAVVGKWQEKGVSLAKLSLQQSMAEPEITVTLGGMATLPELRQSLEAASEPVDTELLTEVLRDFEPMRDRTWKQGREENNG